MNTMSFPSKVLPMTDKSVDGKCISVNTGQDTPNLQHLNYNVFNEGQLTDNLISASLLV